MKLLKTKYLNNANSPGRLGMRASQILIIIAICKSITVHVLHIIVHEQCLPCLVLGPLVLCTCVCVCVCVNGTVDWIHKDLHTIRDILMSQYMETFTSLCNGA